MLSISDVPLFDLRMNQKNACPGEDLAWKREFIKMTCAILRYAPWVYRDEIKNLEYMLVYFHYLLEPFHTLVGFRVYGIFENETSELWIQILPLNSSEEYVKELSILRAFALF